jgi:hypothetical protein
MAIRQAVVVALNHVKSAAVMAVTVIAITIVALHAMNHVLKAVANVQALAATTKAVATVIQLRVSSMAIQLGQNSTAKDQLAIVHVALATAAMIVVMIAVLTVAMTETAARRLIAALATALHSAKNLMHVMINLTVKAVVQDRKAVVHKAATMRHVATTTLVVFQAQATAHHAAHAVLFNNQV